jgi:hypothetical protein
MHDFISRSPRRRIVRAQGASTSAKGLERFHVAHLHSRKPYVGSLPERMSMIVTRHCAQRDDRQSNRLAVDCFVAVTGLLAVTVPIQSEGNRHSR